MIKKNLIQNKLSSKRAFAFRLTVCLCFFAFLPLSGFCAEKTPVSSYEEGVGFMKAELIRRKLGKDAHAMTITLLTDSQGNKMGKTAGNAVWLDPNKTSPYDFYQYWRNVGDADVMKCIRMLTFLPLEQIDEMASWEGADLNRAKEILAWELTAMVHGKEEADKAQTAARSLFSGASSDGSAPVVELTEADLTDGAAELPALLVLAELCPSRGDARRNIQQGGVSVDGEKVTDIGRKFTADELKKGILLRRGKKNYKQIILK